MERFPCRGIGGCGPGIRFQQFSCLEANPPDGLCRESQALHRVGPTTQALWVGDGYLPVPAMFRLDIPDGTDEQALESFLGSLNESAREGVRRMVREGAEEAEVAAYITSFEQQLADEDEESFEEDEAGEVPAG